MAETRQPIVSILGHVDHGKTTLLDAIRETSVAAREAGGITQSIGASVAQTKDGKKITFIDTPGHAAFEKMRSRGAAVADIAVLVVAADDGVKPQTKEALVHIRESEVPFLVAFTKTDLPTANLEVAIGQMEKEGILFEGRGGQTSYVAVSGKTGEGVEELLEMITLMAEVLEINADPSSELEAVVIETSKDKKGSLVSVVVRNGTLKVTDEITVAGIKTRVRGLFGVDSKPIKNVLPGEAAQILGFSDLPAVGTKVTYAKDGQKEVSSDKYKVNVPSVKEGQIPVVVKAQNAGSLEALIQNLPEDVVVIDSAVGDVTENDVFMAKTSNARICAFESSVPSSVEKLADTEGVVVNSYDIIYELIQELEKSLEQIKEKVTGKAEILATFPFNKSRVAGSKMLSGEFDAKTPLHLRRGKKELGKVRIKSLKKGKDEVQGVKAGEEFGVLFQPQLDFQVGDMLISLAK